MREKRKTRAIVASKDDYLILSFRGTDNFTDGLADAFFNTRKIENKAFPGRVHTGFWRLYESIRSEYLEKLKNYAIRINQFL